jgi:hypothetical protein
MLPLKLKVITTAGTTPKSEVYSFIGSGICILSEN